VDEHPEDVAADPREDVGLSHSTVDEIREADQQLVAGLRPE
jgi:hypothetical protein